MPQPFGRGKSELARANYKLAEPTLMWPSIGLGQMLCGRVFDPSRQNLTRTLHGRAKTLQESASGRVIHSAPRPFGRAAVDAAMLLNGPVLADVNPRHIGL